MKKYKAKDKTVQKSGRNGLLEINLHSHESARISSREKESNVRKAPDQVNYQESRRQGRGTAAEKKKQRRRAAVPGNKSSAGCNDGSDRRGSLKQPEMASGAYDAFKQPEMASGMHDDLKQPEMAGNSQMFHESGRDSFCDCGPEPKTVPDTEWKQVQASEMADSSKRAWLPESGISADDARQKVPGSLAGMTDWSRERRQHGSTARHGLKPDTLHLSKGMEDSTESCQDEKEKPSCGQQDELDSGMDAETADGRLFHERGHIPVQPRRGGSIQQTPLWFDGIENRGKRQDRKRRRRKKRIFQSADGKEKSAKNGVSDLLETNIDTGGYSGMIDRREVDSGSISADESRQADSVRQTPQEKKHRLFFDRDEKTDAEASGNGDLKNARGRKAARTAGIGNGHEGSQNPRETAENRDFKDTYSRKRADAETAPPDGSENSSRKHGQPETGGKEKKGRLIFGEKDSGMVCGAGMGIAKHTARHVFHAVDESGSVSTEAADGSGTGLEKMYQGRRSGAAVSSLRHMVRSRSSRMAGQKQYPDRGSRSLQHDRAGNAAETSTGQGTQPDMDFRPGKHAEGMVQQKKSIHLVQQKKRYKRRYQSEARAGMRKSGWAAKAGTSGNAPSAAGRAQHTVFTPYVKKKGGRWILAAVFLLFLAGVSMSASCAALLQGTYGIAGTTYPGSDEDILRTEARYLELENTLDGQVNGMEAAHPGYDEYRYQIDEISHDPYRLASYLTVVYPGYTYEQAEGMLQEILESQYRLTVEEQTEIRTDPDTGDAYEWHVLCISLTNRGLDAVAHDRLTEDQEKLYQAYNLTHGCRDGLFGETAENGNSGGGIPQVPGEALSDQRFANMLYEAEKYLGYPYVWGGSSPQTSFDCSGFVSWVVNHCGNGWNVGRQTAEGLRGCCSYVAPEDAEPGDLIFFQGTYNTPGASHVGIYVGNNRMIHCGNPIQYAELGAYWNLHFLSYGRLP